MRALCRGGRASARSTTGQRWASLTLDPPYTAAQPGRSLTKGSFFLSFPAVEQSSRARLGGEFLGPFLVGWGETYPEHVVRQLVDAADGFPLERSLGVRRVDGLGRFRRIQF